MSAVEQRANSEIREGYAQIADQRLHYVEAGGACPTRPTGCITRN
jgi:hypothetical protein